MIPIIVHIAARAQLRDIVQNIPLIAQKLADAFWPGPLTMIFRKGPSVPANVSAELDTVAVRMPSHPVALALIEAAERSGCRAQCQSLQPPQPNQRRACTK